MTSRRQYPRRTELNSEIGGEGSQESGKIAAIVELIVAPTAHHFELDHRLTGWPEVDSSARLPRVMSHRIRIEIDGVETRLEREVAARRIADPSGTKVTREIEIPTRLARRVHIDEARGDADTRRRCFATQPDSCERHFPIDHTDREWPVFIDQCAVDHENIPRAMMAGDAELVSN